MPETDKIVINTGPILSLVAGLGVRGGIWAKVPSFRQRSIQDRDGMYR